MFTAPITSTHAGKYLARRPTVVVKLTSSQARFPARLASDGIRFGGSLRWQKLRGRCLLQTNRPESVSCSPPAPAGCRFNRQLYYVCLITLGVDFYTSINRPTEMHGRRQMSQKSVNGSYWQTPPGARNQILLIPISLEERIPDDHPVRLLDEILDGLDWTAWESQYSGKLGQPPIHPVSAPTTDKFTAVLRATSQT